MCSNEGKDKGTSSLGLLIKNYNMRKQESYEVQKNLIKNLEIAVRKRIQEDSVSNDDIGLSINGLSGAVVDSGIHYAPRYCSHCGLPKDEYLDCYTGIP